MISVETTMSHWQTLNYSRPQDNKQKRDFALKLFEHFGSHEANGEVTFRLYAPKAAKVTVIQTGTPIPKTCPMRLENGAWVANSRDFEVGDSYLYKIEADGRHWYKLDPFSFSNHNAGKPSTDHKICSKIVSSKPFEWRDQKWLAGRQARNKKAINILEVYSTSWRQGTTPSRPSYVDLARELAAFCAKMHFTHIQLMATLDYFQEKNSVGFKVISYFSPNSRLGGKADFQEFINILHENDVGVLLVWVSNHFSTEENGLGLDKLDGTPIFGSVNSDYGILFDFSKRETQNFLLASALYWAKEMHVDGFYVDYVEVILERQPISSEFFEDLNSVLHLPSECYELNELLTFAEDGKFAHKDLTTFASGNPAKFDYRWNIAYVGSCLPLLTSLHDYDNNFNFSSIDGKSGAIPKENYLLPLSSSDPSEVFDPAKAQGLYAVIPGSDDQKIDRMLLFQAFTTALPGKKLLFMNHLLCTTISWQNLLAASYQEEEIDPTKPPIFSESESCPRLIQGHQKLNHFYKENALFWECDSLPDQGLRNWDSDPSSKTVSFERYNPSKGQFILCLFNYSEASITKKLQQKNLKIEYSSKPLDFTAQTQTIVLPGLSAVYLSAFIP